MCVLVKSTFVMWVNYYGPRKATNDINMVFLILEMTFLSLETTYKSLTITYFFSILKTMHSAYPILNSGSNIFILRNDFCH